MANKVFGGKGNFALTEFATMMRVLKHPPGERFSDGMFEAFPSTPLHPALCYLLIHYLPTPPLPLVNTNPSHLRLSHNQVLYDMYTQLIYKN